MSRPRKTTNVTIGAAFAIAAGWRGWGLWHRGLLEHDEGHALLNANTWWHALRWAVTGGPWSNDPADSIGALRDTLHQQGGTLYSAGKLGYSLLLAVVGLPGHVSTGLALALAWVAGLLVAVLCGVVTWQYSRSRVAAVIAAAGCMTSPLESALAREASGTIWALVFGLAALVLIQYSADVRSAARRWSIGLFGGGLLAYAFVCHFNIAPFIAGVYLAAGLHASREEWGFVARLRTGFRAVLPGAVGGLLGLGLAELATRIVDVALRRSYPEFLPLSGELYQLFFLLKWPVVDGQLYGDGAVGWGLQAWAVYGRAFMREGPVWVCLVLLAPWLIWRRKKSADLRGGIAPALALITLPCVFYAAYAYRVERVLGMIMAPSWIAIALLTATPLQRIFTGGFNSRGRILKAAAVLLIIGQGAWGAISWGVYAQFRSPLPTLVLRTFQSPVAAECWITAGSFDIGFAPLWKWAIVEEKRHMDSIVRGVGPRVDFARFDGGQIVFIDPFTWRRPNTEFRISRRQVEAGQEIARAASMAPGWNVKSVLVADAPTTGTARVTGSQP
jgi:hypothetical protein